MIAVLSVITLCLFLIFYFTNQSSKEKNYLNSEGEKFESSRKNDDFKIMLNSGVFLIILSSIIFATTSWHMYSNNLKVLWLVIETILFLIFGVILKRVFKISKTGNALTLISSVLLFATILSIGYFDIFKTEFSLQGKYSSLFLSMAFLIEGIVLIIRNKIIKGKYYSLILLSLSLGVGLIAYYLTNSFAYFIVCISVFLLLLNVFKDNLFKNTKEFKIYNLILSTLTTFAFIILTLYFLINGNEGKIPLLLLLISLSLNAWVLAEKCGQTIKVLALSYVTLLTIWLGLFSGSILSSAIIFGLYGIMIYIVYYLTQMESIKITSLVLSYISGIVSIMLFCINRDYTLFAPLVSILYLILNVVSTFKDNNYKIANSFVQPVYLIIFAISMIVQPSFINKINFPSAILVINLTVFIALIISILLKSKVKNFYLISLIIGLFFQNIFSFDSNLLYVIISLILNTLLVIYARITKDTFINKSTVWIAILLIINVFIGLTNYFWINVLVLIVLLILFSIFTQNKKRRYLYLSLTYVPIIMIVSSKLPINYDVKNDIGCILLIPFFLLFTRKFAFEEKEDLALIFELIAFILAAFSLETNLFAILFLIINHLLVFVFKSSNSKSAYLTYLMFLTPIIFFLIDEAINYSAIWLLIMFVIMLCNQVLSTLLNVKRNFWLELSHSLLVIFMTSYLIEKLNLGIIPSFIISLFFIIITYFIYNHNKVKMLSFAYLVYPLSIIIGLMNETDVQNVLKVFIWFIPVIIITRFIFNKKEDLSIAIESSVLSFMFLAFLFEFNLSVAITLGIISILIIIIGMLFNYKSLTYVGASALILTVIVQTVHFWSRIPWWLYLLVFGIGLIIVAAIIENKRR